MLDESHLVGYADNVAATGTGQTSSTHIGNCDAVSQREHGFYLVVVILTKERIFTIHPIQVGEILVLAG